MIADRINGCLDKRAASHRTLFMNLPESSVRVFLLSPKLIKKAAL